jgi:hypothetical protein
VAVLWRKTTGKAAPFGRLRLNFQREHCRAINPYGGECPYREEECGSAFLSAVQNSLLPWVADPAAYFVKVAHSSGVERADNKPLAREKHREKEPGHAGDAPVRFRTGSGGDVGSIGGTQAGRPGEPLLPEEADHLRRAADRPQSIGNLLGSINLGTRQGPVENGSESSK